MPLRQWQKIQTLLRQNRMSVDHPRAGCIGPQIDTAEFRMRWIL
jgi:hypothetical protein